MRQYYSTNNLPWLVVGDFNQIIYNSKKRARPRRAKRELNAFMEALEICAFIDGDVPHLAVHHLPLDRSDHRPIKIASMPTVNLSRTRKKRFCFEDFGYLHPSVKN
ncbi:Cyclin-Y-like protein 1-A [Bienertia sinuspersici]